MGLAHPSLNTFSKKKKKHKYASAEDKRRADEADRLQQEMYKKYNISTKKTKTKSTKEFTPVYNHRSSDVEISRVDFSGGSCSKKETPKYTGTLIKGIAQTHKSNAVPVICEEHIKDIARMRRS